MPVDEVDAVINPLVAAYERSYERISSQLTGVVDSRKTARLREVRASIDRELTYLNTEVAPRAVQATYWANELGFGTGAVGAGAQVARWDLIDRGAVEVLAKGLYTDLLEATSLVDQTSKTLLRKLARGEGLSKLLEGRTAVQAGRAFSRQAKDLGVYAVTYANGARHGLDEYAAMSMRTVTANAYNGSLVDGAVAEGVKFFEIFDGPDCGLTFHEDPQIADGLIVDDNTARTWRISHPNCRRSFGPRPDVLSKEQAEAARRSTSQGQRADQIAADRQRGLPVRPEAERAALRDSRGPVHRTPKAARPHRTPKAAQARPPVRPRDALDDVLENPSAWQTQAYMRNDGRWMPGDPALNANKALLARGRGVQGEINDRLSSRGVTVVSQSDLKKASDAYRDASVRWGKLRDGWVDAKVAEGFDWGDAFEASVRQLLEPDYTPPAGLRFPREILSARAAVDAAEKVSKDLAAAYRAYGAEWQTEVRSLLTERRGAGFRPSIKTGSANIDLSILDNVDEAFRRYPTAWTEAWGNKVGSMTIKDSRGERGWNQTWKMKSNPGYDGRPLGVRIITDDLGTTVHEIGHTFETVIPGLSEAQVTFLRYRSVGARGGLEEPRVIPGYARSEKYYRAADTPEPYTAKIYGGWDEPGGHFELFTTLVDAALGPSTSYNRFIAGDEELRDWILGVLFHMG